MLWRLMRWGASGVEPHGLQYILHITINQCWGAMWQPMNGPRGTQSPAQTVPCVNLPFDQFPCNNSLPRHHMYGLYSQHQFFLPVWLNEQIAISLAPDVRLRRNELHWVRNDEAYALVRFEAIPSTLNFWAKFEPLITPPHWEAFGPPKDYFSLCEYEGKVPSPFQPQSTWLCLDSSL